MKTIKTIILIVMPVICMAQSKFELGATTGYIAVGDQDGVNYQGVVSYNVSNRLATTLSYMYADINDDIDFDLSIISIGGEYLFTPENDTSLSSTFGFSYLMFDKALNLEDDNGMGIYFGLKTLFNAKSKFAYGVGIQTTYASNAPGGIIQSNLVLRYKF